MRCTLIRLFCLPGALSLGLLIASNASAVDFNWNVAGPADWNTGGNWDPEGPPAFDGNGENGREFAHINNGGTAEITDVIPDVEDIFVGAGADNSGTLNQSAGSTFVATGSWMFVGQDGGTGTYNLSGGVQNKERLYVGRGAGGNGTLNMSGSGAHNAAELNMGVGGGVAVGNFSGNATVTNSGLTQFANGTFSVTDDVVIDGTAPGAEIWIGNGDGNSATLDMDSGTIETDSWIAIGRDSSNGVVNLSGDARIVKRASGEAQARFVTIGGLGGNQDTGGEVNISENAILESETGIILSETTGRSGVINQSGGTVIARDFVTNQEGFGDSLDVDFSASGEGVYNLSGGVLDVETIDDPLGGFNMTGGMLSFTAFKGSLTQGGGTLSPGDSPGTMTITGDYSLDSGDLFMELEGAVAGTEYDQLIVTGDVSLAGELTLAGAYVPNANDVFTLIDNQGINAVSGAFTGLAEGATVSFNGIDLTLSYLGGDGNDVILSAPVPEPATLALLAGISLVGFVTRRRG